MKFSNFLFPENRSKSSDFRVIDEALVPGDGDHEQNPIGVSQASVQR